GPGNAGTGQGRRLADCVGVRDVDELVTGDGGEVEGVDADEPADHGALRRVRGDGERDRARLAGSEGYRRVRGTRVDALRPRVARGGGDGRVERVGVRDRGQVDGAGGAGRERPGGFRQGEEETGRDLGRHHRGGRVVAHGYTES